MTDLIFVLKCGFATDLRSEAFLLSKLAKPSEPIPMPAC